MPTELIERRIYLIRFQGGFRFRLTPSKDECLIFQIIPNWNIKAAGRGGRRNPPFAFTEHGIAMLSSVLKSTRAVQMNILIIRAFIKLRDLLATHKEVAARLEKLETAQKQHASVNRYPGGRSTG
jgi:hypothetical protein